LQSYQAAENNLDAALVLGASEFLQQMASSRWFFFWSCLMEMKSIMKTSTMGHISLSLEPGARAGAGPSSLLMQVIRVSGVLRNLGQKGQMSVVILQ
jgi:hypothetical protein